MGNGEHIKGKSKSLKFERPGKLKTLDDLDMGGAGKAVGQEIWNRQK